LDKRGLIPCRIHHPDSQLTVLVLAPKGDTIALPGKNLDFDDFEPLKEFIFGHLKALVFEPLNEFVFGHANEFIFELLDVFLFWSLPCDVIRKLVCKGMV
jgi:hypothetical protein